MKCPTCKSPNPKLHPAMQFEGEVQLCSDSFHVPSQEEIERAHGHQRTEATAPDEIDDLFDRSGWEPARRSDG